MAPQQHLDLTDETTLLFEDLVVTALLDEALLNAHAADYQNDGMRELLAALQLKPVSGPMVDAPRGNVFDLAVYRATGDRRLATIFGTAA